MAKTFFVTFGNASPASTTGLSPSFTVFSLGGLTAIASPGITETPAGQGLYSFSYTPTLTPIVFVIDGGATLSSTNRYIPGTLDPVQTVDQGVGFSTDSFGSTSIDPTSLFGFIKRVMEILEGDQTFVKSSGLWTLFNRGSTTLLRSKTIANNSTQTTRT